MTSVGIGGGPRGSVTFQEPLPGNNPGESQPPVRKQPLASLAEVPVLSRPFSTPICGCCINTKLCCFGFWCMPCLMCQVAKRQDEHCCTACCPGGLVAMRTKMRLKYGIEGTIIKDCCAISCCPPCAVCQLSREADHVGI